MEEISWNSFRKALKEANPNLRLVPGPNSLAAMVYLSAPGHIDSIEGSNLQETLAIASPTFFPACPRLDKIYIDKLGKKYWVRGYSGFFKKLSQMRHPRGGPMVKDKRGIRRYAPRAFSLFQHAKYKADFIASKAESESDLMKRANWLKSRAIKMPGYGMPLGWKRERLYSM